VVNVLANTDWETLFLGVCIGLALALIISYLTDWRRVRTLRDQGYDRAVEDMIRFGHYYDKYNHRHDVRVTERPKTKKKEADAREIDG
jgi:hypothetical protein